MVACAVAADASAVEDVALLARVAARDHAAFAALYDRYRVVAYTSAYRLLGERGRAEDVVQEVFLGVWRLAASFDPARGSVRAWLLASTRHRANDRLRREAHEALPLRATAERAGEDPCWRTGEVRWCGALVRQALGVLSPPQREALELRYFGGLTCQEVAARTAVPLDTAKSRLRLGLGKLRRALAVVALPLD